MFTEEAHADGVADGKIAGHEQAAHEKRNWVRLTYHCNDHCIFCLDSDTHDGTDRDRAEIKRQILDGRRSGATRLILSGGEPTIHPNFLDFVKLGRLAGYRKVQTVTNGRMFSYGDFLRRCIDAGLGEITFSLHGHVAKIHDALVGTRGAFDEEVRGLRAALADGRPIVNIDVVINRGNVKHLPDMLDTFYGWGVREFDLLQVVPFGRAFTDGRDTLFYDLAEARPYIQGALAFAQRPDVHVWFNRFPPEHLEGHEHLIQDPYKLNDEVRGRKQEFAGLLEQGVDLVCRDPDRCRYCYVERLCDGLYEARATIASGTFDVVRIEPELALEDAATFGGDPASDRRAPAGSSDTRRHLPVVQSDRVAPSLTELIDTAGGRVIVRASHVAVAVRSLADQPGARLVELDLDDSKGLVEELRGDDLAGRRVTAVVCRDATICQALLAADATFEVILLLSRDTAPWLRSLRRLPERLVVRQPSYDRLTEAAQKDVDLASFFDSLAVPVPVEDVPVCVSSYARPRRRVADAAMMKPGGGLEIFRYTRRFVGHGYRVKSLRCAACVHESECVGIHVNYVRAHGFGALRPVTAT